MSGAGSGGPPNLRAVADRNLVFAFRLLAEHHPVAAAGSRRFGGAEAIVTGVALPFFNPVVIAADGIEAHDVRAAVGWSRARGVEPSLQVREDLVGLVAAVADDLRFVPGAWRAPGMALRVDDLQPEPSELRTRVVRASEADPWYEAAGGDMRRVIPPSYADDPAVVFVVGEVGGRPVSHAIAIGDREAIGIYSVGTIPEARRLGYGRAITAAAIIAGQVAWGADVAILQSSAAGLGLYRAMGFVEVCRYVNYTPAPVATQGPR